MRPLATLGEALPELAVARDRAAEAERRLIAAARFEGSLRATDIDATTRRFARERARGFKVGRAHGWVPDPVCYEVEDRSSTDPSSLTEPR